MRFTITFIATILLLASCPMAHAADWPQWLGPHRASVWREEGIVAELPDELPIKWRVPVDLGYAGPAVAVYDRPYKISYAGGPPENESIRLAPKATCYA